jgi:hypothetical protein
MNKEGWEMVRILIVLVMAIAGWAIYPDSESHALCQATAADPAYTENFTMSADSCNLAGAKRMTLGTCISGESNCYADSPDSYIIVRRDLLSSGQKTADAQIKATPGYVGHMICQGTDNAAVAGTIIVYDSLTETGTALFTFTVAALDYHVPMTFEINTAAATGIYLGYNTTTDVNCTVFYR